MKSNFLEIDTSVKCKHIYEQYAKLGYDHEFFDLYYPLYLCIDNPLNRKCDISKEETNKKFIKMVELTQRKRDKDYINNTEILVLGHQDRFEERLNKPYLKKINLNKIDAGIYSSNRWSETRAYMSREPLYTDTAKFTGTVTASWNNKFTPLQIHNFEHWDNTKILFNSEIEDNIVLCADAICPCDWIKTEKQGLLLMIFNNTKILGAARELIEVLGLSLTKHTIAPLSHQIISHRKIIDDYSKFLKDNQVLDKVSDFVKENKEYIKSDTYQSKFYQGNRVNGYVMEMISMYYFAKQNYNFVCCVNKVKEWYNVKNIRKRVNQWAMTT